MLRIIKILFRANYSFLPPKKTDILIFDFFSKPIVQIIFNLNKVEFLSTRKEEINLFILFKLFLRLKFSYFNYLLTYIDHVNPKLLVTSIDNNKDFYKIKKFKPNLISIFFQNGHRTGGNGDIFEILEKKKLAEYKKTYNVDLMCVFNKMTSDFYKKFIKGETFISGSIKSNQKKIYRKSKGIVFVSLFRPSRSPFKRENKLINIIEEYCNQKKIKLTILGKHIKKKEAALEKKYFLKNLKKNFSFIDNIEKRNTYKYLDQAKIVVSPGSTMGLESLGRENKTAIIHSLPKTNQFKKTFWGYYTKRKDNGFFWGNDITEINIFRILNNLNHITSANWKKKLKSYKYETCKYDFKNRELKRKIVSFCNKYNFNTTSYLQ